MVEVVREPKGFEPPYEHCSICKSPTPYWYEPKDVALCKACAKTVKPDDIPTKKEWFSKGRKGDDDEY